MDQSLWTLITSVAIFCATMSVTPGPNNILLAASGANFGIKKTCPHVLGIRLGGSLLHISILLGLGALFIYWPLLHYILKYLSIAYLIYLAYRIATTPVSSQQTVIKNASPMSMTEAALFQLINPKLWISIITLSSAFTVTGEAYWFTAFLGVLIFNIVGFFASFIWVFLGVAISKKLDSEKKHRHFNWCMGGFLALTIPLLVR